MMGLAWPPDWRDRVVSDSPSHVVILDVIDLLPRRHRYLPRGRPIDRCVVHHTGGPNLLAPPQGLLRTAGWLTRVRRFPGFPYQFYVPHAPDIWPDDWPWGDGRFVVYQTQSANVVSWHTREGGNPSGISVAFQKTARGDISAAQQVCAVNLWRDHIRPRWGLRNLDLQTHSMYGKKKCPGPTLESWVRRERGL